MSIEPETESSYNDALTVNDHLLLILPRLLNLESSELPTWAADVFAVAASLLQRTGAYAAAMDHWPPDGQESSWNDDVRKVGKQWRRTWDTGSFKSLDNPWNVVLSRRHLPLKEIPADEKLMQSLMQLCAVADEACDQLGVMDSEGRVEDDELEFFFMADSLLDESSSLCRWSARSFVPLDELV